jgi:hypothetical protein
MAERAATSANDAPYGPIAATNWLRTAITMLAAGLPAAYGSGEDFR